MLNSLLHVSINGPAVSTPEVKVVKTAVATKIPPQQLP